MEKLSDSICKPINTDIIKAIMASLDNGKGKGYTRKMVGFNTTEDLFPFIIGEEVVWAKTLLEAMCKSRIGMCKIKLPNIPLTVHWA